MPTKHTPLSLAKKREERKSRNSSMRKKRDIGKTKKCQVQRES